MEGLETSSGPAYSLSQAPAPKQSDSSSCHPRLLRDPGWLFLKGQRTRPGTKGMAGSSAYTESF